MNFKYLILISLILTQQTWAQDRVPPILDSDAIDTEQAPCDGFYQYACGGWIKKVEIPAEKEQLDHHGTALSEQTLALLGSILKGYATGKSAPKATYSKLLGNHYQSCELRSENQKYSLDYLKSGLKKIDSIRNRKDLSLAIAELHIAGVNVLFSLSSGQDFKDSSKVIANITQGGMALPDKDYYLKTDADSLSLLKKYEEHVSKIFELSGLSKVELAVAVKAVLKIETELAQKALSLDQKYDPDLTYHPVQVAQLVKNYSGLDWSKYLSQVGQSKIKSLNLMEPEFLAGMSALLKSVSTKELKYYLKWAVLNRSADYLNDDLARASFDFWKKTMRGQQTEIPTWKKCTNEVSDSALGYALAEAYVQTIDAAAIKAKIEEMIIWIKDSFKQDLDRLSQGPDAWMDIQTKDQAIKKLEMLSQKVGAPTQFRNYLSLRLSKNNFLKNAVLLSEFNFKRDLAKIGKSVDKNEWYMMPWEINAYYDPSNNEFVYPFGILLPPYFDLNASEGANLGSFGGGTIGHELTHGYDDDGRKFDGSGNLVDWWSESTKKNFEEKTACFVKQASEYLIQVGDEKIAVNGETVVTENLADQGGVKLGYMALEERLKSRALAPVWNGLNERQQFWLAYAQSWCEKRRPESLKTRLLTDVHPPAEFRVNGVMMNRPEFAQDFGCQTGSKMSPVDRCSIW